MKKNIDLNETMISEGSNIPNMVKHLLSNGWETFRHHDNWVRSEWSENQKSVGGISLSEAYRISTS